MEHDPSLPLSHNHHHHHQTAPPHGMMMPPGNSYHPHLHHPQPQDTTNLSSAAPQQQQQQQQQLIDPNSTALLQNNRFPFNSVVSASTPPNPSSKSFEPLNSPYSGDGSSVLRPSSGAADGNGGAACTGSAEFAIDSAKKKRGRPRKYSPDGGNIALGLTPNPTSIGGDSTESPSPGTSSSQKHRGRPAGSGKRQLDALGNCGVGFTPHVILVNAGEDVAAKLVAFSQQGPRTVCVLSANGSVTNVTLHQSATTGGGLRYEGRFEIISLTGSFLLSGGNGEQEVVKTGGLSISLAGPDGRVLGGGVTGVLIAASQVQIIVGSFVANGKKSKYMASVPESRMLHFSVPSSALSSPSSQREAAPTPSESSDEDGHRLPHHHGQYSHSSQQQQQPPQQQQQPQLQLQQQQQPPPQQPLQQPPQQPQQQPPQQQPQQQFLNMQQMYSAMGWAKPGGTMLHP